MVEYHLVLGNEPADALAQLDALSREILRMYRELRPDVFLTEVALTAEVVG